MDEEKGDREERTLVWKSYTSPRLASKHCVIEQVT